MKTNKKAESSGRSREGASVCWDVCNVNWCGHREMKRPQINTFKSIEPKEDETERSSSGTIETRHDDFHFVGQTKSI